MIDQTYALAVVLIGVIGVSITALAFDVIGQRRRKLEPHLDGRFSTFAGIPVEADFGDSVHTAVHPTPAPPPKRKRGKHASEVDAPAPPPPQDAYGPSSPNQFTRVAPRHSLEQDHYAVLGLSPSATHDEIEAAFRRRVLLTHPDRYFGDPPRYAEALKRLKELNAAMLVLRSPTQRARYDLRWTTGQVRKQPGSGGLSSRLSPSELPDWDT